jgi:hypothetical protein
MNTQTQEALKMAIEALECIDEDLVQPTYYLLVKDAIPACKEALAQSEKELTKSEKASIKFELTLPTVRKILDLKPAQEPDLIWQDGKFKRRKDLTLYGGEKFYTHPAPQPAQEPPKGGYTIDAVWVDEFSQSDTKPNALEMAGFELDGVIADIKMGDEFDRVSFDTVVRVRKTIADYVARPAQEPVAYCKHGVPKGVCTLGEKDCNPAPSWQGLSDDEIEDLCQKYWDSAKGYSIADIIDMAEQALKEKNHGI